MKRNNKEQSFRTRVRGPYDNGYARPWEVARFKHKPSGDLYVGDFLFPEKNGKEQELSLKAVDILQRVREYQLNQHYTRRERRIAHLVRIGSNILAKYKFREINGVLMRAAVEAGEMGNDNRFFEDNPLQVKIGYQKFSGVPSWMKQTQATIARMKGLPVRT